MEHLIDIFTFDPRNPLIFTRLYFWIFFAIVLALYSVVYKRKSLRHGYLFAISLFFYYKTSGMYFSLLIFSTLVDYFIGHGIYKARSELNKKILVGMSIFVNLFVLSYFKYSYFYIDSVNSLFGTDLKVVNHFAELANLFTDSHFDTSRIILPVGISFFTFQTISYSIDVFRNKIRPVNSIIDFGFYVSFFPQLVAGPIVRASEFIPQLYKEYKVTKHDFGYATFLIMQGLVKKMFISDYISVNFIDRIFENPLSFTGFENLMALYGYSLQVYVDFSGYTDIAIGVALLLGFRLPKNFNSPYKSQHVGEFWKRWHISLSTWLKDYLYVPLGGNRKSSLFTYISTAIVIVAIGLFFNWIAGLILLLVMASLLIFRIKHHTNLNLMLTMLLGGLWHGANWQFVIWGGLNGIGLVVYKYWKKISPFDGVNSWIVRFYAIFLTFNFISFTRIWFRAQSMDSANGMMYQISNDFEFALIPQMIVSYKYVFGVMLFGFVVHWLSVRIKDWYKDSYINAPAWAKVIIATIVVFIIYQARTAELQPFIYFQF